MTLRSALLAPLALLALNLCAAPAAGQTSGAAEPSRPAAPTATVTATAAGVRFVALGAVRQTRLEAYDAAGARVYDSDFLAGNVRDWGAHGGGAADGAYTCVLTVRDLAGRMSMKQGTVVLSGGRLSLALGGAEPAGDAEAARPAAGAAEAGAATLATHDGADGAVTSTAGALTLRTGDVLRGEDTERVRVTEGGRVGVGTSTTDARLDVNGTIKFGAPSAGTGVALCRNATSGLIVDCSGSSARFKRDVAGLGLGLDAARRLRPVSFTWREGGERDLGLVAEEVERVEPLLVTRDAAGAVAGVRYDRLGVVLLNAVREQQAQLAAKEARLRALEARAAEQSRLIAEQGARLKALEGSRRPRRGVVDSRAVLT